ncbi:DUF1804 family protein [Halarcobacter anaerophilus]|jgi:predicted transcriptional regulator|uniref:DUF1804 family protein n=1 Tax=Halarcobacter anaerophilus TaxID=877500 RepID=UPI0005C951E4|nr:DUF1804 family protein [Halarcobacter anaerophilus]
MAKSNTKDLAKELYLKGFETTKIAQILSKSPKTINNYKSGDGDWDELRAAGYLDKRGDDKVVIYQNFIEEMYLAVKEIRESNLKANEKASALVQLGDSFSKMKKVASYEDPESYKLAIAKRVVQLIVSEFRQSSDKRCIEKIVELLEDKEFVDGLGNIDVV